MSKKWNLIVDLASCSNCGNCVLAVKDEYVGNDFPGYSVAQPSSGHKWFWVDRIVRGSGSKVDVCHVPKSCNHCDDAPCIKAAPEAVTKRDDGIVVFDPVNAKGRRDLINACPYGAVSWNDEADLPQIWSFDAHLLDVGWREPRPVQVCPTGCLSARKLSDAEMMALAADEGLETLRPELKTRPRIYYRNAQRLYSVSIVGNVVEQDAQGRLSNVAGVQVRVMVGDVEQTIVTDCFGDFIIDGIKPGSTYQLSMPNCGPEGFDVKGIADSFIDLGSITIG